MLTDENNQTPADDSPPPPAPIAYAVRDFLTREIARFPSVEAAAGFMANRVNVELEAMRQPAQMLLLPVYAPSEAGA
jgi:hypothetical protein